MSGLVALADRRGGPVDGRQFDRMMAAIAHRGPDGTGRWHDAGIALGHALFRATPESVAEHQPLRDARCALIWDGRLDNRNKLLAALRSRGVAVSGATDPELAFAAYLEWGPAAPEYLLGEFAFVVWDARTRMLFGARDRMGLRPFYYAEQGSAVLVASEAKALLAASDRAPEPDDVMVLGMLLSELREGDNHRSLFAGIRRLPPAHRLIITERATTIERYWVIEPSRRIEHARPEAYIEHFRSVFEEAVRCRTRSLTTIGSLLSGGLDSSAITAVAAHAGAPVEAFTIHGQHPTSDERVFAQQVAARSGVPLWEFEDRGRDPLHSLGYLLFAVGCPLVTTHSDLDGLHRLLDSRGCRVVLDGTGGDHLVDEQGYLSDLLWHRPGHFMQEARAFASSYGAPAGETMRTAVKEALPLALRFGGKRLWRPLPAWVNPRTARTAGLDARRFAPRSPLAFRSCAQTISYEDTFSPTFLLQLELAEHEMAWRGREIRYPMLDSRLAEFILAVPWDQRCRDGERKWLLRQAMSDLLPDAVLCRRGKGDGTHAFDEALLALCRSDAPEPLANRSGLLGRYVDLRAAEALVDRFVRGARDARWDVWSFVTLDHWLQRFCTGGVTDGSAAPRTEEAVQPADAALVR
jgi:asparagine synthase (glutamine-hydrolysing)